jgi:hypothetical protein
VRFRNWPVLATVLLVASAAASKDSGRTVPAVHSITIDANTVLCLAQRGVQPSAKPVAQRGKRPAGVVVYGVSALGVGVTDGDVLTEVLGQPVRSQVQVVAMVIAARSQAMSSISATLWRGTRPYTLTVEQPYEAPNCSPDDATCWRAQCKDEKPQRGAGPVPPAAKKKDLLPLKARSRDRK